MSNVQKIAEYIQAHRDEMLRDLIALCRIPSVRSEPQPGAPYGIECARCLEAAAQLFRDNGFQTDVYPESGYALASYGDGEQYIGMFGHLDVVPVTPEDWQITPPFDILVKDDVVYGRGTRDDKCGVITSLYIMRAVRDLGIELKHRLVAFMGTNEESGMGDIHAFIREQPRPAACTVPDTSLPYSLGERGILRLDLISRIPLRDVTSIEGGKAYNMVMPSAICTLRKSEALLRELQEHPADWLTIGETADSIELTVQGIAQHAGAPASGISALKRLSGLLMNLSSLDASDAAQFASIARALSDTDGTVLGIANTDPVHGALTVANGMTGVEDGRLFFTFDIRSGSVLTPEEICARIECVLCPAGFDLRVHSSSRAFDIPFDAPIVQCINKAYGEVMGSPLTKPSYMGGGSYSKPLFLLTGAPSFTVCICTGKGMPENLPHGHGSVHQPDEALPVDGFIEASITHANIILALDANI